MRDFKKKKLVMKNNLLFTLFLVFILTPSSNLFAQWEVGVPVDESLSLLTMEGWQCYPTADHWFLFPVSEADGVDHAIIVISAPVDSVKIDDDFVNRQLFGNGWPNDSS